jgi:hypothetical protein
MIHWDQSPVTITFDSLKTSISKIPFPAVTVCNMNALNKQKVRKHFLNVCLQGRIFFGGRGEVTKKFID